MNTQALTSSFTVANVLGLIFITLKLTGYIAWSWWWVLVPFWGPTALGIAILVVWLLCGLAVLAITTAAIFFRKRK